MAYPDYADYDQYTGAARLARLQLHITEVRQQMLATTNLSVAADGKAMTKKDLESYLRGLKDEESSLLASVGTRAGGRSLYRATRA